MRYPVIIEDGSKDTAYGVIVPDLPGCFSAGDTLEEALLNAEEAARLWIDAALDSGSTIPRPSCFDDICIKPAYADARLAVISIDPSLLDDKSERINITLPRRILTRLDAKARAAGETRSGYIAKLAIEG